MNYKQREVLSSYSDVHKISSDAKIIHFRKFISKKILLVVLEKCPKLRLISMSSYASKRLSSNIYNLIFNRNIELKISSEAGRPSSLEKKLCVIV